MAGLSAVAAFGVFVVDLATRSVRSSVVSACFGVLVTLWVGAWLGGAVQASLVGRVSAGVCLVVAVELVGGFFFFRGMFLVSGRPGVRPVVFQAVVSVLGAGFAALVGEFVLLGCSGALAVLSHFAVVLVGAGAAGGAGGSL
ncbi:Aromatic amino acid lyase [Arthrobacter sp. cf158]|nr:Aromatic amino acid lyase [Arthrobacter sp. cf158]